MKILLQYWKLNFLSLMEYKVSFLIQIFWMILNDILFVSVRYMFFLKFWSIWWMVFWDFALMMSIVVIIFAGIHIFFWWYSNIWILIEQWKLDSHLLLPKNILLRLVSSNMMISAFWDLLFVFILLYFVPNITFILIFKMVLLSTLWIFTFLWFLLIFASFHFFLWSSKNILKWMFEAVLWSTHYPPSIFEWTILKYIFMTILPAYFVVFLPYELVVNFDLLWFLKLLFVSLLFLFLWIFTFYRGLRRYESGNMMNTKGL